MNDKDKTLIRPTQEEVAYTTISPSLDAGQACASCRWFLASEHYCHIVENGPEEIMPTGWCNRYDPAPRVEPEPLPVVIVEADVPAEDYAELKQGETGFLVPNLDTIRVGGEMAGGEIIVPVREEMGFVERVGKAIMQTLRLEKKAAQSGFEVHGNSWVGWWTNNFEDREKEFFPQSAIDAYEARVDMGIVPLPELWDYHISGAKLATADMIARVDHLVIAVGDFDDTPLGKAAAAYHAKHKNGFTMSHGFYYDADQFKDGAYEQFNTFEISILPSGKEANPYTKFEEVATMTLTPKKIAHLEAKFGKELANEIVQKTQERSKAIEALGVAFKDLSPVTDEPGAVAEEAVEKVEQDLLALIMSLIDDGTEVAKSAKEAVTAAKAAKDSASTIPTLEEEVKSLKAQNTEQAQAIAELRAELKMTPRAASQADETKLTEDEAAKLKAEQPIPADKFWSA